MPKDTEPSVVFQTEQAVGRHSHLPPVHIREPVSVIPYHINDPPELAFMTVLSPRIFISRACGSIVPILCTI